MADLFKLIEDNGLVLHGDIEYFAELVRQDEREREWVGLTDEEIAQTVGSPIDEVYLVDFRKVIEKLRSKNT